jgi:ankyrin repeat protein
VERILRTADSTIVNRLEVQFRQPALYFAALSNGDEASVELIKLLMRNGANINHKDHNEQTILFYICREGSHLFMQARRNAQNFFLVTASVSMKSMSMAKPPSFTQPAKIGFK